MRNLKSRKENQSIAFAAGGDDDGEEAKEKERL